MSLSPLHGGLQGILLACKTRRISVYGDWAPLLEAGDSGLPLSASDAIGLGCSVRA